VIPAGPRFLDEAADQGATAEAAAVTPKTDEQTSAADALPRGPILLDAAPDAPQRLEIGWEPEIVALPRTSGGTVLWISRGIFVLLMTWVGLSLAQFMHGLFRTSNSLGILGTVAIAAGLGMIGYGIAREWRAYRSLTAMERFKIVLAGDDKALESVRSAALQWVRRVAPNAITDQATVESTLKTAVSVVEIRALLRNRLSVKLREASLQIGQRAAVEGATAVAICPHPALDGLVVSLRGFVMVRQIAVLHGVRPGLVATASLMRRIAVTAAGTSGTAFLSQGIAEHFLHHMPVMKHVAAAVPAANVAAFRLYRLAGITATACCPIQ
jgi:putative membrane protein